MTWTSIRIFALLLSLTAMNVFYQNCAEQLPAQTASNDNLDAEVSLVDQVPGDVGEGVMLTAFVQDCINQSGAAVRQDLCLYQSAEESNAASNLGSLALAEADPSISAEQFCFERHGEGALLEDYSIASQANPAAELGHPMLAAVVCKEI